MGHLAKRVGQYRKPITRAMGDIRPKAPVCVQIIDVLPATMPFAASAGSTHNTSGYSKRAISTRTIRWWPRSSRESRARSTRRMVRWTNDVLVGARRIYEAEGFHITERTPHADFGIPTVGELWEVVL